jgi:hypothetical protein
MEYTEEQLRQFKEEFARRKNRIIMTVVTILVVMTIGVFGRAVSLALFGNNALVLGAISLFAMTLILFVFKNDRCPACSGMISKASWQARFCPLCGVPLS